jgi:hypothetical protein
MSIELEHHVYSSLQGYRTLYASPRLAPEALARAEETARALYHSVGTRPQRGFYRPAPGMSAALRAFACGTDHAGRPRTCVHTVILRDDALRAVPMFNPMAIPEDLFLREVDDPQDLGGDLRRSWDPPSAISPLALWNQSSGRIRAGMLEMLVPALLEPERPAVVFDPRDEAFDIASVLAWALPPSVRRALTYLSRGPSPAPGGFRIQFAATRAAVRGQIFLDFERYASSNDPERNAFSDFLIQSLGSPEGAVDAFRLAAALERYEPDRTFTALGYLNLVEAFRSCRAVFRDDGSLSVGAKARDTAEAVPRFVEAGCLHLARAVGIAAGEVIERMAAVVWPDRAEAVRNRLEKVRSAAPDRLKEALLALTDDLRRAQGLDRSKPEDDTWYGTVDEDGEDTTEIPI